jgi:Tfp pilus assembly protein PilO
VEPHNKDAAQGAPKKPGFSLKPTKQTCMALGGAIGVILLGGGSLYAWQSGELATATTQTQAKRKELDDSTKIAKRREAVQDEYKSLQQKLRYLEDSVAPGTEFEATFLEQISKLAQKEKLQVTELVGNWESAAPAPPPPKKSEGDAGKEGEAKAKKPKGNPYNLFHMDMTVKGPYGNVTHFLSMLNQFPKIVAIEKCDVQPDDQFSKTSNAGLVTARVKMTGFAFKAEEKPLKNNAALPSDGTSGISNPLLPGNGASSKARGAQNDVINSSSAPVAGSVAGTSSNSGAPGVPRPTQIP